MKQLPPWTTAIPTKRGFAIWLPINLLTPYATPTPVATPAAAPKGHEAAGYIVVTAASGQYKFSGNTQSVTIEQNPQLRLRRGYSYIFDFSDGTNSGHQFYFANSTANSTGYAYGSIGLAEADSGSFTAYASVTKDNAVAWAKAAIGSDEITAIETSIAAQITESKTPTVSSGVPW